MNLDELQSVQNRERQSSDLQDLRPSFYADAAEFVRDLREERQRVVEEKGLDSREFERLSNDIETAERAVESVYERRVGKVVKMASIAAADMPTEGGGLTREERDLFESLVETIRANRDRILSTLDPEEAEAQAKAEAQATAEAQTTAEAQATAETRPSAEADAEPDGAKEEPEAIPADRPVGRPADGNADRRSVEPDGLDVEDGGVPEPEPEYEPGQDTEPGSEPTGTSPGSEPTGTSGSTDVTESTERIESTIERTTVRITADVGEILGVDQRAYHLSSEDVVTLPEANADPLVERGAAERLD